MIRRILSRVAELPFLGSYLFYNYTQEGIRLQYMLVHKNIQGYPIVDMELSKEVKPTRNDLFLTERLLKAYKKATLDGKKKKNTQSPDIWTFLKKGPHADLFDLLRSEDISALAFYLCNMSRMGATYGITQGKSEFEKISSNNIYRRWNALFNLDKLITLAEALGVLPVEDPEQGKFGLSIFSDKDEILKKIENYLKISIRPPLIEGGLYKLKTKKGQGLHYRDLISLYTAWRCKSLLKDIKNAAICEIGAGVGKGAYYAKLLGINRYTIIDLPHINFLQGFYLIKSLPLTNISLYGEPCRENNYISILPDWSFSEIQGRPFNLTLNQDSFPEIDRKVVLAYLKQIQLKTKNFFLSINQESQNTLMVGKLRQHIVSELISERKGFEQDYHFPYWMRNGYVEELYKIVDVFSSH